MNNFLRLRILALAAAGLLAAGPRAGAQGFGLSVTPSATSLLVSNSLTYTINLTNLTALPLQNVQVTNLLPASANPVSAGATQGSFTNYGGTNVVFYLGPINNPGFAQLTLTVQPTATGFITNQITVASDTVTNTAVTNVVVLVTNAVADVGVSLTGPAPPVITNDWMTFSVAVTNAGPSAAPNVVLTNTLSPGVGLIGISPASPTPVIAGSNVIFNLGAMAGGAFTNFTLTVQPTNAGVLPFAAFVSVTGVADTNTANNLAVTNVTVTNYLSTLVAVTNSGQTTNLQNGLIEQSVLLSNTGSNDAPAARIVVTGLTNRLFNAAGTNNGIPFVDFSASLPAGQSVNLLLQFAPRKSFPFDNSQLQAFALPSVPDWTPPPATSVGTNLVITRIVRLSNGGMLLEWPAVSNRTYTVVYGDNVSFSNAMIAPPSIVAPANEMQWIDYGPPATASAPTNASARFYRVFLNP